MIFGDPNTFAIESGITVAYERLSFLALGFFILHIGGRTFGVHKPDASMLASSFYDVKNRIEQRGRHTAPFSTVTDAGKLAEAFRDAIYGDGPAEQYFGVARDDFSRCFHSASNDCMWAPDGDEAFDDGSFVLQFDIDDRVRLIAFQSCEGSQYLADTLRDVWLEADTFYDILNAWNVAFAAEWYSMGKTEE